MLLTAGERISMALLAMAIANLGHEARSFTGSQAGVITDSHARQGQDHRRHAGPDPRARSTTGRSRSWPASRASRQDTKDITTLGRGGSDTTAVALAAALGAPTSARSTPTSTASSPPTRASCPPPASIPAISYEEMLEMAACGAKILHLRCVEYARRYDMPIHVRSSFSNREGTWVIDRSRHREEPRWSSRSSPASPTTAARPRSPSSACPTRSARPPRIFEALADAEINIDMIVQNVSAAATGLTDISFTLPAHRRPDRDDRADAASRSEVGFDSLLYDDQIGKVSLIGAGMRSHPGVTRRRSSPRSPTPGSTSR